MTSCDFDCLQGTSKDLIRGARVGARILTRKCLARGLEAEETRQRIITRFRMILTDKYFAELERETLMAAAQRGVESAIRAHAGHPRAGS
jgi:hypothetical protein